MCASPTAQTSVALEPLTAYSVPVPSVRAGTSRCQPVASRRTMRPALPTPTTNVGDVPHRPLTPGSDAVDPVTSGWPQVPPLKSNVPSAVDAQTSAAMQVVPSQLARAAQVPLQ